MATTPIIFYIFLIFTGASILATIALYTRQSLIVAYIALGVLLGPWGLQWVDDPDLISHISDIGIIFLLFLLGLNLDPKDLIHLLKSTTWITLLSSGLFALIGYFVATFFGFNSVEALVVAASMMFSSTIIGLKLLPTTVLHHQHTGEIVISILLLQDLIAIVVMLLLNATGSDAGLSAWEIAQIAVALPLLGLFCYLFERYILVKLIAKFDRIQEFIFLVAIGWCLGIAELAHGIHLSHEIGAFIAGVAIANSPIALFISESLKPLRDFFLVLFFFSLGAGFNLHVVGEIIVPAITLAVLMLIIKPVVFSFLLKRTAQAKAQSFEIGVRLGQVSEFSLLVAYLAHELGVVSDPIYYLIQTTTIITFVVSSYVIVMKYPTPIAMSDKLRRD
jgi:Kef-type K+ transport system membrane component KefB